MTSTIVKPFEFVDFGVIVFEVVARSSQGRFHIATLTGILQASGLDITPARLP
jgi:hypothetical protein